MSVLSVYVRDGDRLIPSDLPANATVEELYTHLQEQLQKIHFRLQLGDIMLRMHDTDLLADVGFSNEATVTVIPTEYAYWSHNGNRYIANASFPSPFDSYRKEVDVLEVYWVSDDVDKLADIDLAFAEYIKHYGNVVCYAFNDLVLFCLVDGAMQKVLHGHPPIHDSCGFERCRLTKEHVKTLY